MAFFAFCELPSVDGAFEAFVKVHELTVRAQQDPQQVYDWRLDATLNVYLKEGLKEPVHRVGVSLGMTTQDFLSGSVPSLLLAQLQANPQKELRFLETKADRVQRVAEAAAAAGSSAVMQ